MGPQIPPSLSLAPAAEVDQGDDEDDYAPALPPGLAALRTSEHEPRKRVLGPALVPSTNLDTDDLEDEIGPVPLPPGYEPRKRDAVREFVEAEERRRRAIEDAIKPKVLKREEWMLAPPSSSDLLSKIDPTRMNKPRQFSKSTAPSRTADVTLWTETPAERQQRLADEVMGKRRRKENAEEDFDSESAEEMQKRRRRDLELRQQVDEHTRKHRGPSLVDAHADREAHKAKEPNEAPPAIWDHSRDMATGGRLMDERDRRKLISDAKGLSDRFGMGSSGGFL
ncbi:hypothetical protein K488DRAFT_77705 [Vararia minispora EC-137]|uniref:Uncharacterized protein n=1 Tax=Vararia minispora EC-137 TaxID=1314806 RepID=A0ACB8QPA7_9AGAM|nr:hypothetical protein K488DRAFT_77705 [Vararia minispora EC-137]